MLVSRQRRHLMRDNNKDGERGVNKSTTETKLTLSAKEKARVAIAANVVDDATASDEVAIATRVVCSTRLRVRKERKRHSSASHIQNKLTLLDNAFRKRNIVEGRKSEGGGRDKGKNGEDNSKNEGYNKRITQGFQHGHVLRTRLGAMCTCQTAVL